jgi:hypothetical protein
MREDALRARTRVGEPAEERRCGDLRADANIDLLVAVLARDT